MVLKKLVTSYTELDKNQYIVVLGSSFVVPLTFTLQIVFWFNAVGRYMQWQHCGHLLLVGFALGTRKHEF
jgi:hypothetical protein